MSLYTEPEWKTQIKDKSQVLEKVNFVEKISPNNMDKTIETGKIFIAQLKYLCQQAMKFTFEEFRKKRKIKFKSNQIQWILTVPAIWNDAAKAKMNNGQKRLD